jgi:hypothetical protein
MAGLLLLAFYAFLLPSTAHADGREPPAHKNGLVAANVEHCAHSRMSGTIGDDATKPSRSNGHKANLADCSQICAVVALLPEELPIAIPLCDELFVHIQSDWTERPPVDILRPPRLTMPA